MQLGIVLDAQVTLIRLWARGPGTVSQDISVPGLLSYISDSEKIQEQKQFGADKISAATAYLLFELPGSAAKYPDASAVKFVLWQYFTDICREYISPASGAISCASISIPYFYEINIRKILLDVLEDVLITAKLEIVPCSSAVLTGYLSESSPTPAINDYMILSQLKVHLYNCSYISANPDSIILEKQIQWVGTNTEEAASTPDFSHTPDFHADRLLYFGENLDNEVDLSFLSSDIDFSSRLERSRLALNGLFVQSQRTKPGDCKSMEIIYPYDFYVQIYTNGSSRFEKIPFDLSNLSLAVDGRYEIYTFELPEICISPVVLRIYEISRYKTPQKPEDLIEFNRVLDTELSIENGTKSISIILDIAAACLNVRISGSDYLDIQSGLYNSPGVLLKSPSLSGLIDDILLKLNKLTGLWYGKFK